MGDGGLGGCVGVTCESFAANGGKEIWEEVKLESLRQRNESVVCLRLIEKEVCVGLKTKNVRGRLEEAAG